MKILLCAATEMEIAPTLAALANKKEAEMDVLITGVGLMAATFSITKAALTKAYNCLLQAGIAGTFNNNETLGKVVAVQSETVGDLGVNEAGAFRSLFDLNFLEANSSPWKNQRLMNEGPLLQQSGLPLVDAITVNEISTSPERIHYYKQNLGAQLESMEGAAFHYAGLQLNVPFLQVRSLSNFIGERDKRKWRMKEAIANLNTELQRILQALPATFNR